MTGNGGRTSAPGMTLDVHSHFVPAWFLEAARRDEALDGVRAVVLDGEEWLVHRQGFRYPVNRQMVDLETRREAMELLGVDVAIVSLSPSLLFYWTPARECAMFSRRTNEEVAELVRVSDGRIEGTATLPMQDQAAAVEELRYAVEELGLRGAQIGANVEGRTLDDAEFESLYATAEELQVPLILHPYYYADVRPGLDDYYFVNLIGVPLDTTVAAARLVLSGTLDRHPNLRIVLLHGGGFLPYQIGRLDHGWNVRAEAHLCAESPSTYLRRFTYDTITHAPASLRFLLDTVGVDRVAYGTDSPFDMAAGSLGEQAGDVGLSADELDAIAHVNGAQLFGIHEATLGDR